jgi:hypothetical protein
VLDDPGCLRALCAAVAGADRLVLLGDLVELRDRPLREALAGARPALEAIAAARPGDGELVVLAGNHDHRLIAPWLERRSRERPIGSAATVEVGATDPLAQVTAALGGAAVSYPGVALRDDVWATHGHYTDRHTTVPILERVSAGVIARIAREAAAGPATTEDHEAVLAPLYAWIDALVEHGRDDGSERDLEGSERAWLMLSGSGGRDPRRRALRAAFPIAIAALNRARIGPLRAELGRTALRRGPLVAMGEVQRRLGVGAAHIVFGHTHRAGPLPGDEPGEWTTPHGAPPARLLNTGCWVRETSFLGADPAHSPYRAGFAAWIDSDPARPPQLVNLLD